ncbi:unnamed protein product, partial [marine sediment metagenome]
SWGYFIEVSLNNKSTYEANSYSGIDIVGFEGNEVGESDNWFDIE